MASSILYASSMLVFASPTRCQPSACMSLSRVQGFANPTNCSLSDSLLSVELSSQGYRSGLPFPPPGDLPDPGIKPVSLACPALAGGFFTVEPPGKPIHLLGVLFLMCDVYLLYSLPP